MPAASPPNLLDGGGPRNRAERYWWLWGAECAAERLKANLFHGTSFSVPYLSQRPSVMTLHDLSPWMEPSWHFDADRIRQRTPLLLQFLQQMTVVTPTEAVRRQAMERFRLHPGRVVAVPLAADSAFRPTGGRAEPPYFLYVGALEPRKNLGMLVSAWREVRKQFPVDLVLAGRRRADFRDLPPEPGLRLLGETPEEALPALYSGALAFVYPSFYEGFGLPVLEAMQCGTPVIASCDAAIGEVAGGAAIQVEAGDGHAWVAALRRAVTEPGAMAERRAVGLERARQFSWERTARLTREVYAETLRRF